MSRDAELQQLLVKRRHLKQQRDTYSRRSLGRRIHSSGSRMFHVVADLDARIADIDAQLEALGYKLPSWEQ